MMIDEKLSQIEGMLYMWDMLSKPYTDEECLKTFGKFKVDGDDEVQITNTMMQTVIELISDVRKNEERRGRDYSTLKFDLERAREDTEKAKGYAALSDARMGDELDKEIEWYKANEGQEDCVYGPVELLGYCRDRLRNRS